MWLVPRQTVNGKLDPMVERMDAKIAKLKEQESQGLIKPTRKDDILAMALGKDEHPGRVRCVGLGASSKQYFGENKRRCVRASQQEVEGLKGQVTKLQSQVDFLQKMIMDMQGWDSEVEHNHRSRHDSCSLKESCSDAEPNKGEWTKCELYWPDLTIMVAKGRVFIPESGSYIILYGKDLDSKTLKVTMDTVISSQEHANVPYSTEEVSCIEDAIGGFIAWLKDMVIYGLDCDTSKGTNISASKPSPLQSIIYWLDPLGYDARTDFIEVATMAMKKFNTKLCKENDENGKKNTKKKKQEIQYKVVKCPKQPNDYECGYYKCRYMLEIIERGVVQIPETYFEGSPSNYEDEQVNEIQKECLEFVEPFIQAKINH